VIEMLILRWSMSWFSSIDCGLANRGRHSECGKSNPLSRSVANGTARFDDSCRHGIATLPLTCLAY
jgi:hypothetical protein